jgi:translocator protein
MGVSGVSRPSSAASTTSTASWIAERVAVASLPLIGGGITGALTAPAIRTWYRTLRKPSWNPPDSVFGPVWTALYASMGAALIRIWSLDRRRADVRFAIAVFALQLGLNLAWSLVFFRARRVDLALAEIAALDASVVATIASFRRLDPASAALLLPYLAWISFATALNASIWRLNR